MGAARKLWTPYERDECDRPRLYVPRPYLPKRRRILPLPWVRPRCAIAHAHSDTTGTTNSSGVTTTITLPTGIVSTDVAVVVFGENDPTSGDNRTITAPSGWTRIGPSGGLDNAVANSSVYVTAFWALGNVANLGFTNTTSSISQSWVCAAFSGVDNTTPIDVQDATGTTNTGSATISANSITIATANAWELIVVVDWLGGAFTATGFTVSASSVSNCAMALLYNTTPKATGATGAVTVTDSAAASGQVLAAFSFALRPSGAAAAYVPYDIPHSPQHQAVLAM